LVLTTCIICALTTEALESENSDVLEHWEQKFVPGPVLKTSEARQAHSKVKKNTFGKIVQYKNITDKQ
jgi:hypothetical protein